MGEGRAARKAASKQRRSQLWQAFQIQRKEDKRLLPYMIGAFVLIVAASVLGYHTIMKLQSVLTWITGAFTLVFMALTIPKIHWSLVREIPSGSTQAAIGALVMVMTGFGLGWINIAADWSRYQSREASSGAIVAWNTLGGALAPALLVAYGIGLAGSDEALSAGIAADPVGTLRARAAAVAGTWSPRR